MVKHFQDLFRGGSISGPIEFLIAGLGNPGQQYEATRHNAGFLAVDYAAKQLGAPVKKIKFKSLCGEGSLSGKRVLLLKPATFMNRSGEAIRDAMQFYKLPPERVILLFDDISLPIGTVRIRRKGTDGGHNGMKSIIYLTGSDDFPRIKIGVDGKPHPDMDLADWVLSRFTPRERKLLEPVWESAYDALGLMVAGRTDEAMNRYN